MKDLIDQAAELDKLARQSGWRYCFIGGIAVQAWGEPRLTKDMDICLFTGFGQEEGFIKALLSRFESRLPEAFEFALKNRVLLLRNHQGTGMNIALAGLPFEEKATSRA